MNPTDEFAAKRSIFYGRAVNWLQLNLTEFDPTTPKVNRNLRLKALSELLFMCSLFKRRLKATYPPMDRFTDYGVEVLRRMTYVDDVHRRPELILPYSIVYKSLRDCGMGTEFLKDTIQSMLDIGLPMATEDNPYRKMELRYALENEDFENRPPPIQTLFQNTSLCTPLEDTPPVLSFGLENIYGLTHVIFYLTDFGFSTDGGIPNASSLRWLVSALLGTQTLEQNWDTVAELLMCCSFLNYFPYPLYQRAWGALFNAQKSNGSLTDNFFDIKKFNNMGVGERGKYYFEQHYHTTLVCAAAAFLTDDKSIIRTDSYCRSRGYSSPLELTSQLAKAEDWVLRTYLDKSGQLRLSSLLNILLSRWVASAVVDDWHNGQPNKLISRIHSEIRGAIQGNPNSVAACDPGLVFLGEGILRKFGFRVDEFETLAASSAEVLENDKSDSRSLGLFPVEHLLESLGFQVDPWGPHDEKQELASENGSKVSAARLRYLSNYVSKATSFGYYKFGDKPSRRVDEVRGDLASLALYHLHHYELEEAFVLIRAMNHAGARSSKPFKESLDFMLAQQRDDGSFGFYAEEIGLIGKSQPGLDLVQELILPVTTSAMWTMSEATKGGFSLFNSIRTVQSPADKRVIA